MGCIILNTLTPLRIVRIDDTRMHTSKYEYAVDIFTKGLNTTTPKAHFSIPRPTLRDQHVDQVTMLPTIMTSPQHKNPRP